MDNSYNLVNSLRILLKWKAPIIILVTIASIGAVIVSYLMPNYYESSAKFYPTNPTITDRQNLFAKDGNEGFIDYFGTKNDVNRLMSIANSPAVTDYIIHKYKYKQIYDVDTTKADWAYWMKKEFLENFKVLKTEFGAVMIIFSDTDPQRASAVTNEIVQKIDEHNRWVIVSNKQKILSIFEEQVDTKRKEVTEITDSLSTLMEVHGIEVIESNNANQAAIVKGSDPRMIETVKILKARQVALVTDLTDYTTLRDQYDASAKENFSSIYIIEKAYPSVRKSKPIRWLICVSTFLIALFLSVLGALLFEKGKELKAAVDAEPAR